MYFIAHSWIAVKPETIHNCWKNADVLPSYASETQVATDVDTDNSQIAVVIEPEIIDKFKQLANQLPNFKNVDNILTDIGLMVGESDLLTTEPADHMEDSVNDDNREDVDDADDEETKVIDVAQRRSQFKASIQDVLGHLLPENEEDEKTIKSLRKRLHDITAKEVSELVQASITTFFRVDQIKYLKNQ